MINPIPYRLCLNSRNEGKIKSYESCIDVRAWSHDKEIRGEHLRAWIKSDMPFCIIPTSMVALSLRTMGCKNWGRRTSKCHPNCKSKVVLESICTSCQTIKQCFQNDPKYEKYFEEEELETTHWPCERCLEALKSIKMFWRIIMEKVFRINFPKEEKLPINTRNNVQYTAKTWQTDIVHEALFIKNITPLMSGSENTKTYSCQCNSGDCVRGTSLLFPAKDTASDSTYTCEKNDTDTIKMKPKPRKVNRSVSVKIKKFDVGCEALDGGDSNYKEDLNYLKQCFDEQKTDVERLKKENLSLKIELQNTYNGFKIDPQLRTGAANLSTYDPLAFLPKPFDDDEKHRVDDVDSEMVITMKNCRHSNFTQVSLLQVLHKSNRLICKSVSDVSCRKENPIQVLAKIQTTIGDMVQREISLASDTNRSEKPLTDINASYHNVKVSKTELTTVTQCREKFSTKLQNRSNIRCVPRMQNSEI